MMDQILTAKQVSNMCQSKPTTSTVHRWATDGVLSPSGVRVFLKRIREGGLYMFRAVDVTEFLNATNGG